MIRILVATTSFPLKRGDGLSPFLWEYCLSLQERGWNIEVVVPHHRGVETEEDWRGIKINRFKYLPERMENYAYSGGLLPGFKKNPFRIFGIQFFITAMYRKVLNKIREKKFDIVNIHWLFPAAFWARGLYRRGCPPIVFTGHGTDVQLTKKFPFGRFADSALGSASGLTVNSRFMLEIMKKRKLPGRVAVIPMGTDIEKFKPGDTRPSESNKILFIGRLIKQKGVNIMLEAFKEIEESIPDAELEIIGYGPEKNSLIGNLESAGLLKRVTFSDAIEHDRLTEKYRSARILALPSLVGEGFGMTVAEAAACGVPAVTFGLGGTSELVVNGETGLIVNQNVKGLAEGFKRLFSNDKLVDEMGKGARKRMENHFSWDIVGDRFDSFFKGVLENM